MDYPDDVITVDWLLLDKMVTSLNDAHLRQKLYKDGEDPSMEKGLCTIRIYAAKHKAQGITVNYLKRKCKGPVKTRLNPTTTRRHRALERERPRTKTTRTSVENPEKNPISKDRNAQQLIRSVDSSRKRDITRWYVERRNLLYTRLLLNKVQL